MDLQPMTAILVGLIGVIGSLGGVALSTFLGARAERRRLAESDARRWIENRQRGYAQYLVLVQAMLRDIDGAASFLPYDDMKSASIEDDELRKELLFEYHVRWDDELQPLLADLSLVAGKQVGELADRVSGALMEISSTVEVGGFFVDFYPQYFRARDLVGLLRNAMRSELGINEDLDLESPRGSDWPWPPELPDEIEYIRRQTDVPGRPELTERERQRLARLSE